MSKQRCVNWRLSKKSLAKMTLLTGASGFIGQSIYKSLGEAVVTVGRSAPKGSNKHISCDLSSAEAGGLLVKELSELGIDSVIHAAGVTPWQSDADFSKDLDMAKTIAYVCEKLQMPKLIFLSGWNVYDMGGQPPFDENTPVHPSTEYGKSKLAVEEYFAGTMTNTKLVILRLASVYGPGQTSPGLITNLAKAAFDTGSMQLGAKETRRDYVFIDDVVRASKSALEPSLKGIFNIGGGQSFSVTEVAEGIKLACNEIEGRQVQVNFDQFSESPLIDNCLDITKARESGLLDQPVPLQQGLVKYIKWGRDENIF